MEILSRLPSRGQPVFPIVRAMFFVQASAAGDMSDMSLTFGLALAMLNPMQPVPQPISATKHFSSLFLKNLFNRVFVSGLGQRTSLSTKKYAQKTLCSGDIDMARFPLLYDLAKALISGEVDVESSRDPILPIVTHLFSLPPRGRDLPLSKPLSSS